ncbi:MAG: DUF4199 domain-containing protein [Rikenellaceae bacterium]
MTIEELRKSFWNDAAKNGLILGLTLTAISALAVVCRFDIDRPYLGSALQYGAMICMLGMFCKQRGIKHDPNGFNYRQNMGYIFAIMLFTGIIAGVSIYILQQFVFPDTYKQIIDLAIERVKEDGVEIDQAVVNQTMAMVKNPFIMVFSSIISMIINGAFIGIFTSIFTRRMPQPTQEQDNTQASI